MTALFTVTIANTDRSEARTKMLVADDFQLERVNCTVCNQDNYQKLFDIRGFNIVKCLNCGLIYTNPCPTEEELKKLYVSHTYRPVEKKLRCLKYKLRVKFFERFAKIHGKFLDIGCSQGDFGRALIDNKNWDYFGIELHPGMTDYARSLNLNVLQGMLSDLNFPGNEFALVTAWHVLEHLHSPRKTLEEVFRILKRYGMLTIALPDVDHLRSRYYGKNWKYFGPPGHLWYFSKTTLRNLLESIGYSIIFARRSITKMHVTMFSIKP